MGTIWDLTDVNEFIIALHTHVAEKCQFGEELSALSGPERVFYVTQMLETEVNNGGFSQFFWNGSGDLSGEVVGAFSAIGAEKTADICQTALSAFDCALPSDREQREALLEQLDCDEIEEVLGNCDERFFRYEEDLNALNHCYILQNRTFFT